MLNHPFSSTNVNIFDEKTQNSSESLKNLNRVYLTKIDLSSDQFVRTERADVTRTAPKDIQHFDDFNRGNAGVLPNSASKLPES
jgi:hypothetical protein